MGLERCLFGDDRVRRILLTARTGSLEDSVRALMQEVAGWRGGGAVRDDTSMLAVELR